MTGHLRAAQVGSGLLSAALVVATVVLAASGAGAAPARTVPVLVEFTDLEPGDRASRSWPLDVERTSAIIGRMVHRDGPGAADWDVQLCPAGAAAPARPCVDLLAVPVGTVVPRGPYEVQVSVHVLDLQVGAPESIEARVTLQEQPQGLAATGAGPVVVTALAALVAALVGLLLVVAARRRRDKA
jgi:hypothetical protein